MSFAFPQVDPETSGQVANMQVPLSRYLEASFDYGAHDTVLNSLARMREVSMADADPTSPVLDPTIANERWGVGDLRFDKPVREATARVLNQRKRDEMDRQFFLSQGSTGMRWLPGFAAGMLGSISNPVDLALMFVPFVGEEKLALSATTTVGKMFARRLVTREALQATFPRAPGLAEAMINGMVGQTMFEVPNLIASAQDHADYGIREAAFNVGAGGAFSATIHGAVRLWQVRRAAKLLKDLDRGTRDAMAKDALNSFLRDEHVDPAKYVNLDERALWESSKFDAGRAEVEALKTLDVEDIKKRLIGQSLQVNPDTPAAWIAGTGEIWTGSHHWSIEGMKFVDEHAENVVRGYHLSDGRIVSESALGAKIGIPADDLTSEFFVYGSENGLSQNETAHFEELVDEGKAKEVALQEVFAAREGRIQENFFKNPENQQVLMDRVDQHVQEHIEKMRQEHDQFGEFGRLRRQEIDRQLAQGKMMPPDQVLAHQHLENFDGSSDAKIDEQITDLKEELKSSGEAAAEEAKSKGVVGVLNEMIEALELDRTKLHIDPFLIETVGKPALRAALIVVRELILAGQSLSEAITKAFEKFRDREDFDKITQAVEREINPPQDFTYTIQAELAKPQPFNVKPERFTADVIRAKLKQLPAPEQMILKRAGIDQVLDLAQRGIVDREKLAKWVDEHVPGVKIRPMLNVKVAGGNNPVTRKYQQLYHELETRGYSVDEETGKVIRSPSNETPSDLLKVKEFQDLHEHIETSGGKRQGMSNEDTLVGDFVSQNVSVPIAFDKMEKPRTIFLAADQTVDVQSSHYSDVFPKERRPKSARPNPNAPRKNMLAWAETHVVTLPDGRRVLHVFELQSDVRQSFYAEALSYEGELIDKNEFSAHWLDEKGQEKGKGNFTSQKEAQAFADQKLKEYQEKVQPLIDHTDEILMKALVKLAKRERLDGVVISDKRTALLTQGHLGEMGMEQKLDDVTGIEEDAHTTYEPPSQAAGMSQAYGQKLPSIMRKITGQAGEAVEMGGRHFLLDTGAPEIVGNMAGTKEPEIVGFNKAFPGSDAPSGTFFPVEKVSAEKPFQMFKPEQVEAPKPQVDAINAAVECLLKRMM